MPSDIKRTRGAIRDVVLFPYTTLRPDRPAEPWPERLRSDDGRGYFRHAARCAIDAQETYIYGRTLGGSFMHSVRRRPYKGRCRRRDAGNRWRVEPYDDGCFTPTSADRSSDESVLDRRAASKSPTLVERFAVFRHTPTRSPPRKPRGISAVRSVAMS